MNNLFNGRVYCFFIYQVCITDKDLNALLRQAFRDPDVYCSLGYDELKSSLNVCYKLLLKINLQKIVKLL